MIDVPIIRLKVRRVNEHDLIRVARKAAYEKCHVVIFARHGGDVCNNYGWPAETEGCVVVATPDGKLWCKVVRLPANKVTLSGVFCACTGFRGLFDDRFSKSRKSEIRETFLQSIFTEDMMYETEH